MKYKILSDVGVVELEKDVNDYIIIGWEPIGGIVFIPEKQQEWQKGAGYSTYPAVYLQAMIWRH